MPQIYEVNSPSVVFERFEDETVLIHMDTGRYYSLDRIGSLVWELLVRPLEVSAVAEMLSGAFAAEPGGVEPSVRELIRQLEAEQLLRPRTDPAPATATDTPLALPQGAVFAPPQLTRYDDMAEILLLDPVHDVDERGWPSRADGAQEDGAQGGAAGAVHVHAYEDVSRWPSLKEPS
jgi:hypothetical protein